MTRLVRLPLRIILQAISAAVLEASLPLMRLSATSHKLELAVLLLPVSCCEKKSELPMKHLSVTDNLIVDTGSSNTWVGAGIAYVKTSTSVNTGQPVAVSYGSGSFSGMICVDMICCDIYPHSLGTEYTDTVALGSGLTITKQSIGVASRSTGFSGVDGILGIGPLALTEGTLTNEPTTTIPTVTMNLYSQGIISEVVVGVSFEPTNSQKVTNGELTFGGTDSTKYTGTIAYT
jgi:hypothetical protein